MTKDKKQLFVLGVLVLVVLAIGAFQFMGGSKAKPAAADEPKKDKPADDGLVAEQGEEQDPMKLYIAELIKGSSGSRDPFAPQAVVLEEPENQQDPGNQVNPYGPSGQQRPPTEIEGGIKPFPVDTGQGGNIGLGGNNGGTTVVPDGSASFSGPYALRGVMIGRTKKMCMLETRDGNQLLALEGQRFGSELESTVVEITESYVVLKHKGEVINLALLGGN